MREFADIRNEPGLTKFISHPLGTLYMVLDTSGVPRRMVRHFDQELPTTLVKPFADLVQAAHQWVESRPELSRLIQIEQPVEIGRDFVARPYHLYYSSTDDYFDPDDPREPPDELEEMRNALRAALGKAANQSEGIIENVLARSLLEPSGKTYFKEAEGKFIVVEPKLTRDEVERWAALSAHAND